MDKTIENSTTKQSSPKYVPRAYRNGGTKAVAASAPLAAASAAQSAPVLSLRMEPTRMMPKFEIISSNPYAARVAKRRFILSIVPPEKHALYKLGWYIEDFQIGSEREPRIWMLEKPIHMYPNPEMCVQWERYDVAPAGLPVIISTASVKFATYKDLMSATRINVPFSQRLFDLDQSATKFELCSFYVGEPRPRYHRVYYFPNTLVCVSVG